MFDRPGLRILVAAAPVLWLLIAGCAPLQPVANDPDDDGIGGTGVIAERGDDDGIGGTGYGGEDGIGGTGLWGSTAGGGDVALFGIAAPRDSTLVVNGHGMFVPPDLEVQFGDAFLPFTAIKNGQVLAVRAGIVDGVISAKAIAIVPSVIGRIEDINEDGTQFEVFGQTVATTLATRLVDSDGEPRVTKLQIGEFVRVSGLQRLDGTVEASLIEPAATQTVFSVTGWALRDDAGDYQIGDLRLPSGEHAFGDPAAARVGVSGSLVGGRLSVSSVRLEPSLPFAGEVDYWSLQGFAVQPAAGGSIQFSNYRGALDLAPDAETAPATMSAPRRVVIELGRGVSGVPHVKRVLPSRPTGAGTGIFIPRYTPDNPGLGGSYDRIRLPIERIDPTVRTPVVPPDPRPAPTTAPPGGAPTHAIPKLPPVR